MLRKISTFTLELISISIFGFTAGASELPKMHGDSRLITASGVSAGAMMSMQLLVAASDVFLGAGSIAGGPYGCANGNVDTAKTVCMKNPDQISVETLISQAQELAKRGIIPPLANLKRKTLFIFNGSSDKVVAPQSGRKLLQWGQLLLEPSNIRSEFNIPAGHSFPTVNSGNPCAQERLPWINSCGYDAALNILSTLYMQTLRPGKANAKSLIKFSQVPFINGYPLMNTEGYAYIPENCRKPEVKCGIHVALHGCVQNPLTVKDAFITKAGYNDWAEANGLIILYPTVLSGNGNPMGCWDWWGYSGTEYLSRKSPQIQSILLMVNQLLQ
jgi:predicted esterase